MNEFYSTRVAAEILQLSVTSVQKLIDDKELLGWRTRGGHRRVYKDSVARYLERYGRIQRNSEKDSSNTKFVFVGGETVFICQLSKVPVVALEKFKVMEQKSTSDFFENLKELTLASD